MERKLLARLPSLRPEIGAPSMTRKVDRLSSIRYGSARYSMPTRLIGATVNIVIDHGALLAARVNTQCTVEGIQSQQITDSSWPPTPHDAHVDDPPLGSGRGALRTVVRDTTTGLPSQPRPGPGTGSPSALPWSPTPETVQQRAAVTSRPR